MVLSLQVAEFVPVFGGVQQLSDMVEAVEDIVVERYQFVQLLDRWMARQVALGQSCLPKLANTAPSSAVSTSVGAGELMPQLLQVFDEVDADNIGLAPRIDLRCKVGIRVRWGYGVELVIRVLSVTDYAYLKWMFSQIPSF